MQKTSKQTASHYSWGEKCDGWHLLKSPTLSVIQETVPSGSAEIKHYHQKAEQFFFILSGIATIELTSQTITLHSHEGLHIPAGASHKLSNNHLESLHFIVTSTPPSHGDRITIED